MPIATTFIYWNHAAAEPFEYETRHNPIQISGCSKDKHVIISQLLLNVRFPKIVDFETDIVPALVSFGVGLDGKFEQYVEEQSAASIIDQESKHATFFKTVGTSLQNKMINRLQKELEQALNSKKNQDNSNSLTSTNFLSTITIWWMC